MKYVASLVPLLAAFALGQSWVVEQIDSTAESGSPVELVKAADGRLWTGYQTKSGVARVACLTDSGWRMTDIRTASVPSTTWRRPFLAAGPHGELCLSCFSSSLDSGWLYRKVGDTWHGELYPFMNQCVTGPVAYDTAGRLYTAFSPADGQFWVGHETDSGWTAGFAAGLTAYMGMLADADYLTVAADGSPWFFAYTCWSYDLYVEGDEIELMHFCGDTWARVWGVRGFTGDPIPLALAPHGDGVGNLTFHGDTILCDSEPIAAGVGFPVAGLTYSAEDVPLVAWVCPSSAAAPIFAFKTDRWRTENVPGPAGYGGIEIEVGDSGHVFIVYSTEDSGLWCARGTDVVGVKESSKPQAASHELEPTIVRGVLVLGAVDSRQQAVDRGELLDATGRRVAELHAGANDVSRLAPGVYFVRSEPSAAGRERSAVSVRKVVIPR